MNWEKMTQLLEHFKVSPETIIHAELNDIKYKSSEKTS